MIVSTMKWIVVDLDGTLCDVSHRAHLAQAREWDEFNSLCSEDEVIESTRGVIEKLTEYFHIILVTGRESKWRSKTEEWLRNNGLENDVDHLLMRPANNYEPDHELKLKMVIDFFGGQVRALDSVQLVLEDRDKVVESYRNAGFICWQVRQGDY